MRQRLGWFFLLMGSLSGVLYVLSAAWGEPWTLLLLLALAGWGGGLLLLKK